MRRLRGGLGAVNALKEGLEGEETEIMAHEAILQAAKEAEEAETNLDGNQDEDIGLLDRARKASRRKYPPRLTLILTLTLTLIGRH